MSDDRLGPLRVHSDLRLIVGGLRADIVADGDHVTVHTEHPVRLLEQAAATSLPLDSGTPGLRDLIGLAGRVLGEVGLSASVRSPRGAVIEVGHGCGSRSGRLLLGSDAARLGSARAVLPVAATYVLSTLRQRVSYLVAGVTVAALLGGATVRRRTSAR